MLDGGGEDAGGAGESAVAQRRQRCRERRLAIAGDDLPGVLSELGRRFGAYIPGLPLAKSETLCDELWSYAARPENSASVPVA